MQTFSFIAPETSGFELMRPFLMTATEPVTAVSGLDNRLFSYEGDMMLTQPFDRTPIVGQYFDQDFFGSSGQILNNFVESGQVWALLIGLVLGYLIRGLTTY